MVKKKNKKRMIKYLPLFLGLELFLLLVSLIVWFNFPTLYFIFGLILIVVLLIDYLVALAIFR